MMNNLSMGYELYIFDFDAFNRELSDLMVRALEADELDELTEFISVNLSRLTNPINGTALDEHWRKTLKPRTVHDYAAIALTAYYAPQEVIFIEDWMTLDDILREIQDDLSGLLLGYPFGPPENHFLHAQIGDYFMSPIQVQRPLATLEMLLDQQYDALSIHDGAIDQFSRIATALESAVESAKGVYIRL
jgi:hypothetical protein